MCGIPASSGFRAARTLVPKKSGWRSRTRPLALRRVADAPAPRTGRRSGQSLSRRGPSDPQLGNQGRSPCGRNPRYSPAEDVVAPERAWNPKHRTFLNELEGNGRNSTHSVCRFIGSGSARSCACLSPLIVSGAGRRAGLSSRAICGNRHCQSEASVIGESS